MKNSYVTIVKSTGLIGIVKIIQMVFGLVKNKVVAVMIGPEGYGIWGLYQTFIEMLSSFSSLGLNSSGVRQIARNSKDELIVAKTIYVFKRTLIVLSLIGTIVSMIFSRAISVSLFGTEKYSVGIVVISVAVFFNVVAQGYVSILNGLRNLKGLAKGQIVGTVVGTLSAVLFVYFLDFDGITWALLSVAIALFGGAWWYVRKMHISKVVTDFTFAKKEIRSLLKIGLGFSGAGIISTVMTYFSRIYLNEHFNLDAVGIYQACWVISNLYIGILLTSMGVDLMPRLMKSNDDKELNRLINEQSELGILLSSVGVVTILFLSSFFLELLYSAKFVAGNQIMRWQVLGVALRVFGFPIAYVIMCKGKALLYFFYQTFFWVGEYLLLILFARLFGFDGLGINYFVGYTCYVIVGFFILHILSGYRPSKLLIKIFLISLVFILLSWFLSMLLSGVYKYIFGVIVIVMMITWIFFCLKNEMNINLVSVIVNQLKKWKSQN